MQTVPAVRMVSFLSAASVVLGAAPFGRKQGLVTTLHDARLCSVADVLSAWRQARACIVTYVAQDHVDKTRKRTRRGGCFIQLVVTARLQQPVVPTP